MSPWKNFRLGTQLHRGFIVKSGLNIHPQDSSMPFFMSHYLSVLAVFSACVIVKYNTEESQFYLSSFEMLPSLPFTNGK